MTPPAKPPKISILLADDSGGFRTYVTEMLKGTEFTVWEAHDSPSARKFLASPKLAVDILLTDTFERPEIGWELALDAATLRPGIKVLLMSSRYLDAVQSHASYVHQGVILVGAEFILKPFSRSTLIARLQALWKTGPHVRLEQVSGVGMRNPGSRPPGRK